MARQRPSRNAAKRKGGEWEKNSSPRVWIWSIAKRRSPHLYPVRLGRNVQLERMAQQSPKINNLQAVTPSRTDHLVIPLALIESSLVFRIQASTGIVTRDFNGKSVASSTIMAQ